MTKLQKKPDVLIEPHGTIFLFRPESGAAKAWLDEHIAGDAQWFGGALVVEHRYAENLAAGMLESGLTLA